MLTWEDAKDKAGDVLFRIGGALYCFLEDVSKDAGKLLWGIFSIICTLFLVLYAGFRVASLPMYHPVAHPASVVRR